MSKSDIQNKLLNLGGFTSHYSGKNKTFYLDNCPKHFQSTLFNDIEKLGYKIIKN